jgi:hypothetical protein
MNWHEITLFILEKCVLTHLIMAEKCVMGGKRTSVRKAKKVRKFLGVARGGHLARWATGK